MAFQEEPFLARGHFPQADDPIVPGCGQRPAIGRKGQGVDGVLVPPQEMERLTAAGVPQPDAVIGAGGSQQFAVGRKQKSGHGAGMPLQNEARRARRRIPRRTAGSLPALARSLPSGENATRRARSG